MKIFSEVLNKLFGIGLYISLFAGGLAFIGFLIAIIMGGSSAEAFAVAIQKQYFPIVIRVASLTIACGLVRMYINNDHALSLISDKKEHEDAMEKVKKSKIEIPS